MHFSTVHFGGRPLQGTLAVGQRILTPPTPEK